MPATNMGPPEPSNPKRARTTDDETPAAALSSAFEEMGITLSHGLDTLIAKLESPLAILALMRKMVATRSQDHDLGPVLQSLQLMLAKKLEVVSRNPSGQIDGYGLQGHGRLSKSATQILNAATKLDSGVSLIVVKDNWFLMLPRYATCEMGLLAGDLTRINTGNEEQEEIANLAVEQLRALLPSLSAAQVPPLCQALCAAVFKDGCRLSRPDSRIAADPNLCALLRIVTIEDCLGAEDLLTAGGGRDKRILANTLAAVAQTSASLEQKLEWVSRCNCPLNSILALRISLPRTGSEADALKFIANDSSPVRLVSAAQASENDMFVQSTSIASQAETRFFNAQTKFFTINKGTKLHRAQSAAGGARKVGPEVTGGGLLDPSLILRVVMNLSTPSASVETASTTSDAAAAEEPAIDVVLPFK